MKSAFVVALGGGAGSALRFLVGAAFMRPGVNSLPWGTFTINVTGAFALGFFARYFAPPHGSSTLFLALTVGVCGGYTTFSTFTLEMFTLAERGAVRSAIMYALASVVVAYAALALGYVAARTLRPLP